MRNQTCARHHGYVRDLCRRLLTLCHCWTHLLHTTRHIVSHPCFNCNSPRHIFALMFKDGKCVIKTCSAGAKTAQRSGATISEMCLKTRTGECWLGNYSAPLSPPQWYKLYMRIAQRASKYGWASHTSEADMQRSWPGRLTVNGPDYTMSHMLEGFSPTADHIAARRKQGSPGQRLAADAEIAVLHGVLERILISTS